MDMSKNKKTPNDISFNDPPNSKDMDKYLKEHKRRLKRLEREASGENMEAPWGEYEH